MTSFGYFYICYLANENFYFKVLVIKNFWQTDYVNLTMHYKAMCHGVTSCIFSKQKGDYFLISMPNIDFVSFWELPQRGGSNGHRQSMLWAPTIYVSYKNKKIQPIPQQTPLFAI